MGIYVIDDEYDPGSDPVDDDPEEVRSGTTIRLKHHRRGPQNKDLQFAQTMNRLSIIWKQLFGEQEKADWSTGVSFYVRDEEDYKVWKPSGWNNFTTVIFSQVYHDVHMSTGYVKQVTGTGANIYGASLSWAQQEFQVSIMFVGSPYVTQAAMVQVYQFQPFKDPGWDGGDPPALLPNGWLWHTRKIFSEENTHLNMQNFKVNAHVAWPFERGEQVHFITRIRNGNGYQQYRRHTLLVPI